ncbi:MAG TPA: DUF2959 domain-containing protein [Verrucomicrobiales bacterium]|nr:DUF2959 domain-containing protein [Verrucomicrobiales bacterium]
MVAVVALVCVMAGTGCRSTYYSVMETFGKHKRDLLRSSLTDAGETQQEATEQFKDALTQLQELTGFDGGELEKRYRAFKADYDGCVDLSDAVTRRIRKVERIASDLFAEWERELNEIGTPSLRADSRRKLSQTRMRYEQLHATLIRAETSMAPVLAQMKDYVLYLKHNLNAVAIGSLKSEAESIGAEINSLIADMNRSIEETQSFVMELEAQE